MPDTTKIEVRLKGCDDTTTLELNVTDDEWSLLTRVELLSEQASDSGCQPTLHVSVAPCLLDAEEGCTHA